MATPRWTEFPNRQPNSLLAETVQRLVGAQKYPVAAREWGWKPSWDLDAMTRDMLEKLAERLRRPVEQ